MPRTLRRLPRLSFPPLFNRRNVFVARKGWLAPHAPRPARAKARRFPREHKVREATSSRREERPCATDERPSLRDQGLNAPVLNVGALNVGALNVEALNVAALNAEALDVRALDVRALDVEALDLQVAQSCRVSGGLNPAASPSRL